MTDHVQKVPDPASIYERAKPAKASPDGKLDLPKPPAATNEDNLQKQNKSPEEHAKKPGKA